MRNGIRKERAARGKRPGVKKEYTKIEQNPGEKIVFAVHSNQKKDEIE